MLHFVLFCFALLSIQRWKKDLVLVDIIHKFISHAKREKCMNKLVMI